MTLSHKRSFYLPTVTIQGFQNEKNALDFISSNSLKMKHLVVFDDIDAASSSVPKNIKISIRPYSGSEEWRTEYTFPFFQTNEPRDDNTPGNSNTLV